MNARRWMLASVIAVLTLLSIPGVVQAHPLGNFTINHFAAVVVSRDRVSIHWVLDMAEIPAFAARQQIDADRNGVLDARELNAWLDVTLPSLVTGQDLEFDGSPVKLAVIDRQISFPPGQGGLSTLRLVVDLATTALPEHGSLTYRDATYPERIGWHEIVAGAGAGMALVSSDVPKTSVSDDLRHYPADALTNPVDVRSATLRFETGGQGSGAGTAASSADNRYGQSGRSSDVLADLAGGNLTLLTALVALLLAFGLGAVHAISPGHGKTLVGAYLIGSQGSLVQAVWLGITVAVSHTLGVFALGTVTLLATELLVPERLITWLSLASGLLVVALGGSLMWRTWRSRRHARGHADDASAHGHSHEHLHAAAGTHTHAEQPHANAQLHSHAARGAEAPRLSAGGIAALGLVGGMVPSASALLVLLVAVTTGRIVFGVALIVAFGVGMALVLAGVSASVVLIRRRVEVGGARWARHRTVVTAARLLPVASALAVLTIGLALSLGAARALG